MIEVYKNVRDEDTTEFEIIFISSDKDDDAFWEYYCEMPWLAMKFNDDRKKTLSRIFDVSGKHALLKYIAHFIFIFIGIPTLIVLNTTTGETVTTNGRGAVEGDPHGEVS